MSKLDDLIEKYCPNGVEYQKLGNLGTFYNGLTGKSKTDFTDGNAVFISYMNVYKNMSINIHTSDRVKIGENEKQHLIEYGDVLFTGSSETPDECGICSVLTEVTTEPLYLNSFCFGFRFNNKDAVLPDYSKYVFADSHSRKQICATASGVTRFNVSKKLMERVEIPIPPLPVQQEIVRILDEYTSVTDELKSELNAELTARKLQYSYYRDKLLTFGDDVVKRQLKEIADIHNGYTPSKAKIEYWENGTIPWIRMEDIRTNGRMLKDAIQHITPEAVHGELFKKGSVIISTTATIGEHALLECDALTNQQISCVTIKDRYQKDVLPKYLFYYAFIFDDLCKSYVGNGGGTFPLVPTKALGAFEIAIPSVNKQKEIVEKLDVFSEITSDLEKGLPKEIELRTKQYEYYRDKLLNFKRKDDA